MPFTREQAYQTLAALKPAAVFLQSYGDQRLPENLDIYFGPPGEFFIAPETQEPYAKGRLVPILDDGNFGEVLFYDPDSRSLLQIDVEAPDEVRSVFTSWQQYLADLLIRIGESGVDDESLRRIANLVQFHPVEELFAFYERAQDLADEQYEAAKRQFLSGLPAS
jgi:hypothetical protein